MVLYLDEVTSKMSCVKLECDKKFEIENRKPLAVTIYDYYMPSELGCIILCNKREIIRMAMKMHDIIAICMHTYNTYCMCIIMHVLCMYIACTMCNSTVLCYRVCARELHNVVTFYDVTCMYVLIMILHHMSVRRGVLHACMMIEQF